MKKINLLAMGGAMVLLACGGALAAEASTSDAPIDQVQPTADVTLHTNDRDHFAVDRLALPGSVHLLAIQPAAETFAIDAHPGAALIAGAAMPPLSFSSLRIETSLLGKLRSVMGGGTTTLTVDNTYTCGTTISADALQLGSGGTTGSIAGDVVGNGVPAFNRFDAVTFAGVISGSGAVNQTPQRSVAVQEAGGYQWSTALAQRGAPISTRKHTARLETGLWRFSAAAIPGGAAAGTAALTRTAWGPGVYVTPDSALIYAAGPGVYARA